MREVYYLLSAIILIASLFVAQPTNAKEVTEVTIAGRTMRCETPRGLATIGIENKHRVMGGAIPEDNYMFLNSDLINAQPPVVRWWIFSHECGHLVLEENSKRNPLKEYRADEYALNRGVKEGWFTVGDLDAVCASISGEEPTKSYPSRYQRCDAMRAMLTPSVVPEFNIEPWYKFW